MKKRVGNVLLLHIIVFIFGFTGILGKLISAEADVLVWWRMIIATAAIVIWMKLRKLVRRPFSKSDWRYILTGFLIAGHWICFFHSIKISSVSIALACLSASTLFTSIIEPIIFKRKILKAEIFLGVMVMAGLLMIFSFEFEYIGGIIVGLTAALLASCFSVLNGTFIKNDNPYRISQYEMIGGVTGITLFILLQGKMDPALVQLPPMDWVYIGLLGVVCTAFAFVANVKVLEELTPFTVSMAINLEPVYGIIFAWLIFGESEKMSGGFYVGTLIILSAIFLNSFFQKRRKRKMLPL